MNARGYIVGLMWKMYSKTAEEVRATSSAVENGEVIRSTGSEEG